MASTNWDLSRDNASEAVSLYTQAINMAISINASSNYTVRRIERKLFDAEYSHELCKPHQYGPLDPKELAESRERLLRGLLI